MQKVKVVQIGQRSFTVKELPVRAIWGIFNGGEDVRTSLLDRGQQLLSMACPELTTDAILDLYPSEIEELWKGFEEVNAAFLGMVRQVGLDLALIEAVKAAVSSSIGQFAPLSQPATGQESGTTVTASF